MNTAQIIALSVQGLVFILWAFMMFRTMFSIKGRATVRTGKTWPGPIETLREWGIWWRDPARQTERRVLILLTLCLIALVLLSAYRGVTA